MRLFWKHLEHSLRLLVKHTALVPFGLLSLGLACCARFWPRKIDIGIGPEPLVNQKGHKKACLSAGYSAETFVTHTFYYSRDFDIVCRKGFIWRCLLAWRCLFRYRALYFYFKGGPFAWCGLLRLEPWIYKLAGTKTLVTAYGGDCQDFYLCRNLLFKHGVNMDYPHVTPKNYRVRERVNRWTLHADFILSGCDWVWYTPRWNELCLAHFTVDTEILKPVPEADPETAEKIIVLHAPNHMTIKGSHEIINAVHELAEEGLPVKLDFVQNVSNEELYEHIRKAHIIADQLIIGWYGMFAVEGMSAGKPVMCFLDQGLVELFEFAHVVEKDEIPIVRCDRENFRETLRQLVLDRAVLKNIGRQSRQFALKYHSVPAMGKVFARANRKMGIMPNDGSSPLKRDAYKGR